MLQRTLPIFVLSVLIALPAILKAQSTIKGTVVDSKTGDPLPGVNLVIEGTQRGAATDSEGSFRIDKVEAGRYTLVARYIGYQKQKRTLSIGANATETVEFKLKSGALNLDEVVVTGTGGPVEKRKLGNQISTIGTEQIENAPIQSFSDALQGRVPGMVGLPSSGVTGEGTRIRIRGSASLSQSNEPIVIVDGIRIDRGGGYGGFVSAGGSASPSRLDDINPNSIKRVEVLKGAAAATLYGTEASNGVIQVFTKDGQAGDPRFDFRVKQGIAKFPRTVPANTGYATTQAQADTMSRYLGRNVRPYELVQENYVHKLYETGVTQEYSASVSGGSEGITYFVNGRWTGEDGPMGGDNFPYPPGFGPRVDDILDRMQLAANLNVFPSEDLQLHVRTSYNDSYLETYETGNNINGITSGALHSKPELVSHDNPSGSSYVSTVQERLQQKVSQDVQHFSGSAALNYRLLQNLHFDATLGLDYTSQFSEDVRPFGWNINNYAGIETDGARRTSDRSHLNTTMDVKGTLENQLGNSFTSKVIGGAQLFRERNLVRSIEAITFPGPGLDVTNAAENQNSSEFYREEIQAGFFLQEQLGYNDYLFATVGGRYDMHSAFGSNFSGVFYPKVSLSFVPSSADFWKPVGPVSSARIRAAVGQSGLQPGAFDALTTYQSQISAGGPGIVPENLGNQDLKPEISTEYELGIDLGLFDERYSVDATYWNRTVRDALVQRQFAPSGGFLQTQLDNLGKVKGQGVELGAEARVIERQNFSAELHASAAYLWEQVESLGGAPSLKVGGSYARYRQFVKEGYAPGAFFGAKLREVESGQLPLDQRGLLKELGRSYSGVPEGQPASRQLVLDYLNSLSPQTASLSDLNSFVLMADEDGDGDPLDHYLGKPSADWKGNFGASASYKNLEISTLFEYRAGNFHINNLTDAFRERSAGIGRNTPASAAVERQYVTGGVNEELQPQNSGEQRLLAAQTWMNEMLAMAPFSGMNQIQKADFVRWREVSISYNFSPRVLNRLNVRKLSVSLSGRNLALWSTYPGVDPEVNAIGRGGGDTQLANNFLQGTDAWNMPIPRRFFLTVNLGL